MLHICRSDVATNSCIYKTRCIPRCQKGDTNEEQNESEKHIHKKHSAYRRMLQGHLNWQKKKSFFFAFKRKHRKIICYFYARTFSIPSLVTYGKTPSFPFLPLTDFKSILSHTDKVTVKAWSAVKITNFTLQLSGFMMLKRGGGLANCLSLQRNHHTVPVQQQLMCKSLPTNETTSWNVIKYMTGALGNPKDSWFESTHFVPIQRCPSAKPLARK